jgi:hypothetical protein
MFNVVYNISTMSEIYVSVDVEVDGPIPGQNSMLSLGAAAFIAPSTEPIDTFSVNFDTLDGAEQDPETMAWWRKEEQHHAWEAAHKEPQKVGVAIERLIAWVDGLPGIERKPSGAVKNAVFVGYPVGFDFTFTYWYLRRFGTSSPFGFSALDMESFAMPLLGTSFGETRIRNMPEAWIPKDRPLTHRAVEDAIRQGVIFMNMLAHSRRIVSERQEALRQVLAICEEGDKVLGGIGVWKEARECLLKLAAGAGQ